MMFLHGRREEAIFCCWSGRRKRFYWRFKPICLCSSLISAASQVNWSLVLTLEQSITPHCVCTLLKIHNWSCIESMLTVSLYLNKLNKAKSSEDPLIYPMTRRETPSFSSPDTFVNKICRLHNINLFYNSSP